MRVLFVEDDRTLGKAVCEHISSLGYSTDWITSAEEATDAIAVVDYELVLLDLNLPDGDGMELLRRQRRRGNKVPVIIITAMDQIAWRIEGLNSGADDYIVKPFDLSELSARMASLQRRYAGNPNPVMEVGKLKVDLANRMVDVSGERIDLSAREWAVLERLLRHPGAIVSKGAIEDSLYEFGAEIESNAVEVYVSRLRKKLGRDAIGTVRGAGYRVGV